MSRLNWYKFSSGYNPGDDPDFIGYHCQNSEPNGAYDGIIVNNEHYARNYFLGILEALPFSLRDQAMESGLLEQPEDSYSKEFEEWTREVAKFLKDNGVRWIFVSDTRPLIEFGQHCFYVSMNANDAIWIFDDPGVNDIAYVYVYMIQGELPAKPKLIPIEEDEDENEQVSKEEDFSYWSLKKDLTKKPSPQ